MSWIAHFTCGRDLHFRRLQSLESSDHDNILPLKVNRDFLAALAEAALKEAVRCIDNITTIDVAIERV